MKNERITTRGRSGISKMSVSYWTGSVLTSAERERE
jgi:hypothetical protein